MLPRAQALLTEAASLFAAIGNLIYPQWCLEGLARAAVMTLADGTTLSDGH